MTIDYAHNVVTVAGFNVLFSYYYDLFCCRFCNCCIDFYGLLLEFITLFQQQLSVYSLMSVVATGHHIYPYPDNKIRKVFALIFVTK